MRLLLNAVGWAAALSLLSSIALALVPEQAQPEAIHASRSNDAVLKEGDRALGNKRGKHVDSTKSRSESKSKHQASKGSKGSKSSKSKKTGPDPGDKERTVYETVEFTVETICGSRSSVQNRLESAFLAFFEEEFEECDSDRDVVSLVLVEFEEAESCSDDDSPSGYRALAEGRRLQNRRRRSRGRLNRKSRCNRCRRRLGGLLGHGGIGSSRRVLGRKRSKYSSKGSKSGSKSGSKTKCSADLVQTLREEGFDDVKKAEIVQIEEVDCSFDSKDCTSTSKRRGACCGVYRCACNVPSESLCKANDFCVEVAHPFDADFCEGFGDTSDCKSDEYPES